MYSALADLGTEEREKELGCMAWSRTVLRGRLYRMNVFAQAQAFVMPPDAACQKFFRKLLKWPLPKEVTDALFTDDGFLHGLGRTSFNLEAHEGSFTLHSHLNHGCDPDISVRHLDQRTALSRITAVAKGDIAVGEGLAYLDPSLGEQSQLYAWGFGECNCERCLKEKKENDVI